MSIKHRISIKPSVLPYMCVSLHLCSSIQGKEKLWSQDNLLKIPFILKMIFLGSLTLVQVTLPDFFMADQFTSQVSEKPKWDILYFSASNVTACSPIVPSMINVTQIKWFLYLLRFKPWEVLSSTYATMVGVTSNIEKQIASQEGYSLLSHSLSLWFHTGLAFFRYTLHSIFLRTHCSFQYRNKVHMEHLEGFLSHKQLCWELIKSVGLYFWQLWPSYRFFAGFDKIHSEIIEIRD